MYPTISRYKPWAVRYRHAPAFRTQQPRLCGRLRDSGRYTLDGDLFGVRWPVPYLHPLAHRPNGDEMEGLEMTRKVPAQRRCHTNSVTTDVSLDSRWTARNRPRPASWQQLDRARGSVLVWHSITMPVTCCAEQDEAGGR